MKTKNILSSKEGKKRGTKEQRTDRQIEGKKKKKKHLPGRMITRVKRDTF